MGENRTRWASNPFDFAGVLTVTLPSVPDAQEEAQAQLMAKLQPERIRATLAFAGLYQIAHALIQQAVLEEVPLFYRRGFDETGWQYDEDGYAAQVLSRAPKSRFRASLLWLVHSEAITLAQANRLDEIYDHRHDLTHELIKYVVDVKVRAGRGAVGGCAEDPCRHPPFLDPNRGGRRDV
jgi:hypothetical protein